jgi:hypothetical protein
MIVSKITRITWKHPADPIQTERRNFESDIFLVQMELQQKTKHHLLNRIDSTTFERCWSDLESAEKYIQNQQKLAAKYGGEIVSFDILDLDKDFKRNYNR